MTRFSTLLFILFLSLLAGCEKGPGTGGSSGENGNGGEDPDHAEECLKSNIIYNGNLSLYSFNRWPAYEEPNNNKRRAVISHLCDLGGIASRESIWNSYGSIKPLSYGETYDFTYNDKVIDELQAAGLGYCLQIKVDAMVANPDNYGPQWLENLEWYVGMVAERYGSAPLYYIPMNEPDNEGQRIDGVPALTTDQIVRVQKAVYETLKSYDPDIKVASSPCCLLQDDSQYDYTSSGREVLLGGITRYCDYFAFHKHVDIGDDGRYTEMDLWDLMDEAEQAGFPRKPALVNENGTWLTLGLVYPEATDEEKHRFKAYWAGNDLIQMKALGLKYIVMYSLAGSLSQNGEYNLIDLDTPSGDDYLVVGQEYEAYKSLWNPAAHALSAGINGGFESPNPDKSRDWAVSFRGRSFNGVGRAEPKEWDYVSIVEGGSRSGDFCLEMRPIDFTPSASIDSRGITANRCRRLVEGLVPGKNYMLSAWVKIRRSMASSYGTAGPDSSAGDEPAVTLKAMGYDSLGRRDGSEDSALHSESDGKYIFLQVSFTADNPWVVISLEHNGIGYAWWDDVALEAV